MAEEQTLDIVSIANAAADKHGVPRKLLLALIEAESGGNPNAKSRVGAMGLTQLMPGTAKDLGVTDPWDPVQNVNGGAKYLSRQLKKFGSVDLALAAYNAGPGRVAKSGNKVPDIKETREYVNRITRRFNSDRDITFKPRKVSSPSAAPAADVSSTSLPKKSSSPPSKAAGAAESSLASEFLDTAVGPTQYQQSSRIASDAPTEPSTVYSALPVPTGDPAASNYISDIANIFRPEEKPSESTSLRFAMDGEDKVAVPQNKQEEDDFRSIGKFEYDRREALMRFLGQLQESEEKSSGKKNLFSLYPTVFDERILALLDRSPINEPVK